MTSRRKGAGGGLGGEPDSIEPGRKYPESILRRECTQGHGGHTVFSWGVSAVEMAG